MSVTPKFDGLCIAAFESRMSKEMAALIARHGGVPQVAPSMREVPLTDHAEALAFGEELVSGRVDMVIFLTGIGTKVLIEVLRTRFSREAITAALSRARLVVRGPKPAAALKELGLTPHLTVPEPNTSQDIVRVLDAHQPVESCRVAVQEYGLTNADLLDALTARGAQVLRVPVYRWMLPEDLGPLQHVLHAILAGEVDVMLVTNAVQVDHVMQMLGTQGTTDAFRRSLERMVVASIGPTASDRLRRHGLPVDLEPSHPKMGVLVKETAEQAHALLAAKRQRPMSRTEEP